MICLQEISKVYRSGPGLLRALNNISFEIDEGEVCAITGSSGSGKSTLLNLLGLLDAPTSGDYLFKGKSLANIDSNAQAKARNTLFGFIFQAFHLLPRMSALDNVALPLSYQNVDKSQARDRAMALLQKVGLADRALHRPYQLSGGQQQRVAVARALVCNPSVIFADEPTGNLDSRTADDIFALLAQLNRGIGVTIIIVTHDESIAQKCSRHIVIRDGSIVNQRTLK